MGDRQARLGVEPVVAIEPDDIERVVDDEAVDAAVFVGADAELPSRNGSEMLIEMSEAVRPRRPASIMWMIADRLVGPAGKGLHRP